jgi:serine/threonine protein kinase
MPSLTEGQKFGRYRVQSYLGGGVTGESYQAEDMLIQRQVVLKLLHPWAPLPDAARRQFFRELQDLSALKHPYLAALLDYGEITEQLFITRAYLHHGSLLGDAGRQWYHSPIPIVDAVNMARRLAQPLYYIHNHGYIHGSLTFSNVQVVYDPQHHTNHTFAPLLITDVGLAHFVRRFGRPQVAPLPVTAAPEQIRGHLVPASDQYALAVLTYFWLTGQLPFVGSPMLIEQKKLSEEVASPSIFNPNVSAQMAGILKQALSVYPENRYPSIIAFTEALHAATITPALPTTPLATPVDIQTRHVEQSTARHDATPTAQLQSTEHHISTERLADSVDPVEVLFAAMSGPQATKPAKSQQQEAVFIPLPVTHLPTTSGLSWLPEPIIASPDPATSTTNATQHDNSTQTTAYFTIQSPQQPHARSIALDQDTIAIGHAGASDVLLDQDPLTSRRHAVLQKVQGDYHLYDCQSTYGTTINGQKIRSGQAYTLKHGDCIGIGNYVLTFETQQQPDDSR